MSCTGCAGSTSAIPAAAQPSASPSGARRGATGDMPSSKAASAGSRPVRVPAGKGILIMSRCGTGAGAFATRSGARLLGVREEELLAVDLVFTDRRLALGRDQPIDEGLAGLRLDARVLFGVHQHDPILVEQPLVALDHDIEIA